MAFVSEHPVWFITGCSTGFGRALAQHTLSLGYPTVITARNVAQIADLKQHHGDLALLLELDVTNPEQVAAASAAAQVHFGRIDVLVNNAGIGYFGAFEESDLDAARRMFEINVWGLVEMTRAVLPGMRAQKSGSIVNISSIGGLTGFAATGCYHGTKFAVEGMSESLALEVAPLGIKVMLVEPGPFRTDWAGRSADEAPQTIADYAETVKARVDTIRGYSGKQPGDPVRAAAAIVKAVEAEHPPRRLLLGKLALNLARTKLETLRQDVEGWAEVTEGADFPAE